MMRKNKLFALALLASCAHLFAEQLPAKMIAALQPFVQNKTLAGAVMLIANKDKVLDTQVAGFSDVENKTAMQPDAMFWIASMTKPVTATALMMLVDEGKVKLDDPVSKYIPEFAGQLLIAEKDESHVVLKKPAKAPTVRMLLNHTSGMLGYSALENPALDVLSLREEAILYGLSPLIAEPGTKWAYNNPAINMAGRVIEVVSGMKYEDFVQARLFDSLGMKDTTFWPSEAQLKRLAKSYKSNTAGDALEVTAVRYLTAPYSDRKRHAFPGGGLFSTAQDMATFCRMILRGGELNGKRFLSAEAVKEMGSMQTESFTFPNANDGGAYGLGWFVLKKQNDLLEPLTVGSFGHSGAYNTVMWIDAQRERVYIMMMQHANFPGNAGPKVRQAFLKAAGVVFEDKCDVCFDSKFKVQRPAHEAN